MIQDDDNIVMRDTAEDAQFEADLNRELDSAVQYNRGREISWTFPITLVTHGGQKSIQTLSYFIPQGVIVESIPQRFRQFMRDKVNAFREMTIQNQAIINNSSLDLENNKLLFTNILIGAHK